MGGLHGPGAAAVGFFVGQNAPTLSTEPRVQSAPVGALYLDSNGGKLWVRESSGGTPTWTQL